jgi:hypothetical protein
MKTLFIAVGILTAQLVSAQRITTQYDCDYCIISQGASAADIGMTSVRYDMRYLRLADVFEGSTKVANTSDALETYVTHQFAFTYKFIDNISASLIVPFSSRSSSSNGDMLHSVNVSAQQPQHHTSGAYSMYVSGLTDMYVVGRWRFLTDEFETYALSLTAGVKLPTGSTTTKNSDGELVHPHLQLGSGSTDPLVGLDLWYSFGDLSLLSNVLTMFPSQGAQNYQFGTMVKYNLGARYPVWEGRDMSSFSVLAGAAGYWHAKEKASGVVDDNTGGNTIYLYPGIQYNYNKNIALEATAYMPIVHNLNGTQLGDSFLVTAGVQYAF